MLDVLIVFGVFFGSWAVFYRWAKRSKGLSTIISLGGGFLVGAVSMIVAFAIVVPTPGRDATQTASSVQPAVAATPAPFTPVQAKQAAKEARKMQLEKLFSAWDGSHRGLETLIKKAMNDPDSYKHVETVFWDMNDHLVVRTTYRGKNAYGGVVTAWVKAKVNLEGEVLAVIETND